MYASVHDSALPTTRAARLPIAWRLADHSAANRSVKHRWFEGRAGWAGQLLHGWGFPLLDAQVTDLHLVGKGAIEAPRNQFVAQAL